MCYSTEDHSGLLNLIQKDGRPETELLSAYMKNKGIFKVPQLPECFFFLSITF